MKKTLVLLVLLACPAAVPAADKTPPKAGATPAVAPASSSGSRAGSSTSALAAASAPAQPSPAASVSPAVPETECEVHKARKAMADAVTAGKGKTETVKVDNGVITMTTVPAKQMASLDKAAAEAGASMTKARDGTAKLCGECQGVVTSMKAGKVLSAMAKVTGGYATAVLSSDGDAVKGMHAKADAAAMPAAKK